MSSEIISESQKASLLQLGLSERKLLHLQTDNEYLLGINYILCKMWPEVSEGGEQNILVPFKLPLEH